MHHRIASHLYAKCYRSFLSEEELLVFPFRWVKKCLSQERLSVADFERIRQTPAAKRQEYVNIFNKSSQYSRCRYS